MKILKLASALIITSLLINGCTEYTKGDYKISLLLGHINDEYQNKQTINKTIEIQLKRLDLYGIPKENIKTEIKGSNIFIEINEINRPERVEKLLTQQGKIEFWETYNFPEVYDYFYKANKKLSDINYIIQENNTAVDTSDKDSTEENLLQNNHTNLLSDNKNINPPSTIDEGFEEFKKDYPLFALLIPYIDNNNQPIESATVGYSSHKDTSEVNRIFKMPQIKHIFPNNMVLAWEAKPMDMPMSEFENEEEKKEDSYFRLIALKAKRTGKPSLEGDVIVHAREEKNAINGMWEISMSMNADGSNKWAIITKNNIGKQIAIVIDGSVYSAPNVNSEIEGGNSSVSGNFTQIEASDMALMLDTESLAYKLKVLEKEITKIK